MLEQLITRRPHTGEVPVSVSRVADLTAADHRRDEMSAHELLES